MLSGSSQGVKIYKRQLNVNHPDFKLQKDRLKVLFDGFNEGYILADNIFLDKSKRNNKIYDLYIIEPDFTSPTEKYQQLNQFLVKNNPSFSSKQQIFKSFLQILSKLHKAYVSHLSLSTKNIWIDSDLQVYLRPFIISLEELNDRINNSCLENKFSSFYFSPEETFISDFVLKNKSEEILRKCDLWGVGCVFYDLFCCFDHRKIRPLFETRDTEEKLFKFFEILRFPSKDEMPFLDFSYFEEIKKILNKKKMKQEKLITLMRDVGGRENEILRKMLVFDPRKRFDCEKILKAEFFLENLQNSPNLIKKEINKKLFSSGKSKKIASKSISREKYDYDDGDLEFSEDSEVFKESAKKPKKQESLQKKIMQKHVKSVKERQKQELYDDLDEKYCSQDSFLEVPKKKIPKKDAKNQKNWSNLKKTQKNDSFENEEFEGCKNQENNDSYKNFNENYEKNDENEKNDDKNSENYSNKTFSEQNNNSLLTAKDEWSDLAPIITPKYDIILSSLKKPKPQREKIQDFSTKSMFLASREPSYELSTTNLSNVSKRKIKKLWFEIKIPRLFVFQSLRNSEVAIELLRKTKKGGLLPQDSINYVIFYLFYFFYFFENFQFFS